MGSIYRSEFMSLCQIFLQTDAAYQCVAELGEIGVAMFRDLNEELNAYQRKFVNEVRRCEEMDRKLRFIEEEINNDGVEIVDCREHIRSPQPKDMVDLENTFEKIEEELQGINASTKTLRNNHTQIWEMSQVIEKVKELLDAGHTRQHASTVISESGVAVHRIGDEYEKERRGETELKFLAGVIARDKVVAFEKFLWRMCRGNVFLRATDCDSENDEFGRADGEKSVFILFFSGDQLQQRVDKICKGFHARLYNCPENPGERVKLHGAIQAQLADLTNIVTRTFEHRARVINAAAATIATWKIKVLKIKMIFHTLNMFSIDVTQKCLIAECWTPTDRIDDIRVALRNGTIAAGSMVHPVLNELETHDTPPTYFIHNKFTQGFQNIVDSYGVPTYREINPAPWCIISFPFIFGVMFGDTGHACIMLLSALLLVGFEKRIIDAKIRDEIFNIFFSGRYIILLMSIFSLYTGVVYNDFFSKSVNIFGSYWGTEEHCWNTGEMVGLEQKEREAAERSQKADITMDPINCTDPTLGPYPFGVDPIWNIATNKLNFLNPMKMKMSVCLGVLQMFFGLSLSLVNYIHKRSLLDFFWIFIPQLLFLTLIFIYLCVMIILKWIFFSGSSGMVLGQWYPGSNCAPSLLIGLINMFMVKEREQGFGECTKNLTSIIGPLDAANCPSGEYFRVYEQCGLQLWYPHQSLIEIVFLIVAVVAIPVMLFVKPCYLNCLYKRRGIHAVEHHIHSEDAGPPEFVFGDVMVYQAIHTIEYVLGCVSHTASYLRLWALSLAHAQLSEVLWSMLFNIALSIGGWAGGPVMFILFFIFAVLSVGILVLMEGLSAFLHALRLHWVEFQSKFYQGQGIAFEPFYFFKLIRISEGLDV